MTFPGLRGKDILLGGNSGKIVCFSYGGFRENGVFFNKTQGKVFLNLSMNPVLV